MKLEKILTKWFDEYEIKARIFPVIILSLPFILLGISLQMPSFLFAESFFIILFCKVLMGFVQTKGNDYQDRMIKEWGGLPSTRYIRKADKKYTIEFKNKFINKVKKLLDIELDIKNDQSIITVFSAIRAYLHNFDKRKNWHKFDIDYGFFRNLSGLRIWIIGSYFSAVSVYIVLFLFQHADTSEHIVFSWLILFLMFLIIQFYSPKACQRNAVHYAESVIMSFFEMPE